MCSLTSITVLDYATTITNTNNKTDTITNNDDDSDGNGDANTDIIDINNNNNADDDNDVDNDDENEDIVIPEYQVMGKWLHRMNKKPYLSLYPSSKSTGLVKWGPTFEYRSQFTLSATSRHFDK